MRVHVHVVRVHAHEQLGVVLLETGLEPDRQKRKRDAGHELVEQPGKVCGVGADKNGEAGLRGPELGARLVDARPQCLPLRFETQSVIASSVEGSLQLSQACELAREARALSLDPGESAVEIVNAGLQRGASGAEGSQLAGTCCSSAWICRCSSSSSYSVIGHPP